MTELILENKLHNRSTAEVAAMLSSITCQYKASQEAKFEPGSLFYEVFYYITFIAFLLPR